MGAALRFAKAGEMLTAKAASKLRRTARFFEPLLSTKEGCTIAPKTEGLNTGQWVCADCGEVFQNNAMAHSHAPSHRRVWWTGERFEEP